jgi:urease alpha subunit
MADLVLWHPMFFGVKPEMIIKGGQVSWSQAGIGVYGDVRPEPVCLRKKFGAVGRSPNANSVVFVSKVNIFFYSKLKKKTNSILRHVLN